jgi:hypothetical protein
VKNDKYVVFKAKDVHWEEDRPEDGWHPLVGQVISDNTIGDAVVIRLQDIFAGPGLHGYAAAIQTAIDIARSLPGDAAHLAQWEGLEELRDFFHEQAILADQHPRKKLPD